MSVIVKNGEYENLDFKNLEPGSSVTLKVTGSKDFTNTFDGEVSKSRLFFSTVGSVTKPDGTVVEAINRDVSFFINEKTKWSKPMYEAFSARPEEWLKVTLSRIELVKYEVRGKKLERYAPIFVVEAVESPSDAPAGESEASKTLPMPKPIFIQICKVNGLSHGDSFEYDGVAYKIGDYVSEEEYSG
jgi:hypothetical protein